MGKKSSPTLADIARASGYSKGSVSRALSLSEAMCPLRPESRAHIIKVASEMGYRVNPHARALSKGRSQTIALAYEGPSPILHSVYSYMLGEIVSELRARDFYLLMLAIDDTRWWEDALLTGRVDGVICLHEMPERLARVVTSEDLPTVLINGRADADIASIYPDDTAAAREATRHLIDHGHRDIVFVHAKWDDRDHYSLEDRRLGFRQALETAGIDAEGRVISGAYNALVTVAAKRPTMPTAILAYSHFEGVTALRQLQERGLSVPGDVSLMCFNDAYPVGELQPPMTCMAVPAVEVSRRGVQMLIEQIESDGTETPAEGGAAATSAGAGGGGGSAAGTLARRVRRRRRQVVVTEKLIQRDSVAPPPRG